MAKTEGTFSLVPTTMLFKKIPKNINPGSFHSNTEGINLGTRTQTGGPSVFEGCYLILIAGRDVIK